MVSAKEIITNEKVDTLERRIREKIEVDSGFADPKGQALYLERIFKAFDRDNSGNVSLEEFQAACLRLNIVGQQLVVVSLFDRYDDDDSGFLDYKEFSRGLFGLESNSKADPIARGAVERMRDRVLQRGGRNGIRTLGKLFQRFDSNGNKKLDREEITRALSEMGIPSNPSDVNIVFKAFDRDGNGSIDFEEFLRGMRGAMPKRRKRLVKQAFSVLDKTGDGVVTIDDLIGSYDTSGHPDVKAGKVTEREALEEFMSQWDKDERDGIISYQEFLEYYKDISASIDDDDYFELMIRNAWRMSGGSGSFENTANRRVLVTHTDGRQSVIEIKNDLGLKANDITGMRRRLEAQGVKDIAQISTAL